MAASNVRVFRKVYRRQRLIGQDRQASIKIAHSESITTKIETPFKRYDDSDYYYFGPHNSEEAEILFLIACLDRLNAIDFSSYLSNILI